MTAKRARPSTAAPASACRLGLVLSGGGSRGIAHIGVLRALEEHGIRPDCIAGVSAGAIVGALYAGGHPRAAMLDFFRETHPYRSTNWTLAKPGIWDSMKYAPEFRRYFPDDRFEALRLKLSVVATDLLSGEPRVFDSGPLVLPLLASSSVPMVFSPTEIDQRWYGDGGIVDNFPVQLVEGRSDVIVGVHVNPLREIGAAELGSSLAVLERAFDVGMFARSRAKFARCDVVIHPGELASYGLFDSKNSAAIEEAGYAETIKRLPEIRRALARVAKNRGKAPAPES